MSGNKDKTISKRAPTTTDINFAKLAIDLDSDHEYHLTKTTTETYKLTKSSSKSKGKESQTVGNRRHSLPPQPSSSKATPRKTLSPPRDTKELLARLINQFDDRAAQSPSAAGYTAWRALVGHVAYMHRKNDYIQDLKGTQASQLYVDLDGILHEAEYGSDVTRDFQSLRAGASSGASRQMLRETRSRFLKSWGETVRKWQGRVQVEADRSWNEYQKELLMERTKKQEELDKYEKQKQAEDAEVKAQEKLKELEWKKHKEDVEMRAHQAQEKLKELEKRKEEQKDQAKKVRFNFLSPFS